MIYNVMNSQIFINTYINNNSNEKDLTKVKKKSYKKDKIKCNIENT